MKVEDRESKNEAVDDAIPIREVLAPRNERIVPADHPELPYIGLAEIEAHTMRLIRTKSAASMKSSAKRFYPGDVIYSRLRPYLNKVWPSDRHGICSSEFIVIPGNQFVDPCFLAVRLNAMDFVSFANSLNAGDRPRVNFVDICSFCLPLFSLDRQRHTAAKLKELLSELDKGVESLKRARVQLTVYRQSVLKHAFEGNLTAQWRMENKDNLETPKQLLARIKREREERYEEQLEEWKVASLQWYRMGKKEQKPKKPLVPKPLSLLESKTFTGLPPLPYGWQWARIGEIGLLGTGVTPLKSKSEYYVNGDVAWVTSGALNDRFVRHPTDYVTTTALNETNLRVYPINTLLIALYGEGKTRGRCSELLIEATTNQAIAAIVQEGIEGGLRGLLKWFLTKNYQKVRTDSSGGVQPNLNLGIIAKTPVPICSINEAAEIEKQIENRFSQADELEEQLVIHLQRADVLRQSILKRAFSGQLVPQDPNDEPASVLLDRIKAGRKQKVKSGMVRRRTRNKGAAA